MADDQIGFVFGFTSERTQIEELCAFLIKLGAKDIKMHTDEVKDDTKLYTVIPKQLMAMIPSLDVLSSAPDINDVQVEQYLNSVLSLLSVSVRGEDRPQLIEAFSAKLSSFTGQGWSSRAGAAIRVLSNLFYGLQSSSGKTRYHVYADLVTLCAHAKLITELPTDLSKLNAWFAEWSMTLEEKRALLRKLRDALAQAGKANDSAEIMLALLDTYNTKETASLGVADAEACVATAIKDKHVYVMDHLLRLAPVQLLKDSNAKLWKLLDICVRGTLTDYEAFTKSDPQFVTKTLVGDADVLRHKMQQKQELTFDEISKAVGIKDDEEIEEFVIGAIREGAVKARIDNCHRLVIVRDGVYRTFGTEQWTQLRTQVTHWHTQLTKMQKQLNTVQ